VIVSILPDRERSSMSHTWLGEQICCFLKHAASDDEDLHVGHRRSVGFGILSWISSSSEMFISDVRVNLLLVVVELPCSALVVLVVDVVEVVVVVEEVVVVVVVLVVVEVVVFLVVVVDDVGVSVKPPYSSVVEGLVALVVVVVVGVVLVVDVVEVVVVVEEVVVVF